ncbi:EAL domain-containing protein [Caldicellulosiruptoraceae bacterium PP1]
MGLIKKISSFILLLYIISIFSFSFARHREIKYQEAINYPPLKYVVDGKIYGFSNDLSMLIFENDVFNVKYSYDNWTRVYKRIKNGEIDICGIIAETNERKKYIDFSQPVYKAHVGIFTRKDFMDNVNKNNLYKYKVGVLKDSFIEEYLKNKLSIYALKEYDDSEEVVDALISNKVDAIVEAQEVVNYFSAQNNLSDKIKLQQGNLFSSNFAYGIRKGDTELLNYVNGRIDFLKDKGLYETIYQKYFYENSPYYVNNLLKKILIISFFIVIFTLLLIVLLRFDINVLRKKLSVEQGFLQAIFENSNVLIIILDKDGLILSFNKFAEFITGYSKEQVVGKKWIDIFIPDENKNYMNNFFRNVFSFNVYNNHENDIIEKNGRRISILWNNKVIFDPVLNKDVLVAIGIDISALKESQMQLEEINSELEEKLKTIEEQTKLIKNSEERYKFIVENMNDGLFEIDLINNKLSSFVKLDDEKIEYLSNQNDDVKFWTHYVIHEDIEKVNKKFNDLVNNVIDYCEDEVRFNADNQIRWLNFKAKVIKDVNGNNQKIIGIYTDITKKKEYEEKLRRLAYFDVLTLLPNRLSFEEQLVAALDNYKEGMFSIVLLVDIDNFKNINDVYGHSIGDRFLIFASQKLLKIVNSFNGFVARFSGDEFAVLINDIKSKDEIHNICDSILKEMNTTWTIDDISIFTSVSIGVCIIPDDGNSHQEILRNVDIAMHYAKEKGRQHYQIYMPYMMTNSLYKIDLEKRLRLAIENDEFEMFYQPIVDIKTLNISGVEALVRWINPDRGIIAPSEFIPIAEETGLIIYIGETIIKKSLKQLSIWNQKGINNIKLSVNISAKQFMQKDLITKIIDNISSSNIRFEDFEIEITESIAMGDIEYSSKMIKTLFEKGISIAIDDFGTGYSSLNYINKLNINRIKIDRSFTSGLEYDKESRTIVEVIVYLAHKLGLKVVSEGIESRFQYNFLKELNCDYGQGYLFSKPLPANEIEKLLLKGKIEI